MRQIGTYKNVLFCQKIKSTYHGTISTLSKHSSKLCKLYEFRKACVISVLFQGTWKCLSTSETRAVICLKHVDLGQQHQQQQKRGGGMWPISGPR